MARRYHQSKRDRMDESYGMRKENPNERSKHEMDHFNDELKHDRGNEQAVYRRFRASGNEFYAGMEPRRRQEMEDAGMIHEDHDAIANLPQNVMMVKYPKTGPYMPEGLEDSIRGIDHQMDYDDNKRKEHFYPKKI
jgi:hypothetical protein